MDEKAQLRVDDRLAELTVEEKCRLLGGASIWRTHAIERVGIPALKMSDGPNGLRGEAQGADRTAGVAVPVGIAVGASWDPDLAAEVGDVLGREAVRKGAHVLLAPTVNLQRTPIGGRVFECMSEDPELTAALAVAYVGGVQRNHVAVTVKHFVANDTERDRMSVDARVPERALRELYLRPFEAAVRDGGAWGIMSAYNRLDGEHCAGNRRLLQEILRDEWGFDGFVVSDWLGSHDTAGSAAAGLDVPMPGPSTIYGASLERAVAAGTVPEARVDELVRDVLVLIERTRADDRPVNRPETTVSDGGERALCRRASAAGTVLLQNRDDLLPLDAAGVSRVALVGPNVADTRIMGGGSSGLLSLDAPSVLEAMSGRPDIEVVHEPGVRIDKLTPLPAVTRLQTPEGAPGLRLDYHDGFGLDGELVVTQTGDSTNIRLFGSTPGGVSPEQFTIRVRGSYVPDVDGPHTFGLVVTGQACLTVDGVVAVDDPDMSLPRGEEFMGFGSEEQLHTVEARAGRGIEIDAFVTVMMGFGALRLGVRPPDPDDLLDRAVARAADADVAVVVVGTNDEWETEGTDRDSIALPGDQDDLVRRVAATGRPTVVVINAGSPVAMPWVDDVDAIVMPFFGGMEVGPAVADILFGEAQPGGRLPVSFPRRLEDCPAWEHYLPVDGIQTYGEGLDMGYRGMERNGTEPLFPFGHGLSYGDISWGAATASADSMADDASVSVSLTATNQGDRAGTAVVQGYVAPLDPPVARPPRELRVWRKLTLEPGQAELVTLEFARKAFQRWCEEAGEWVVDPGRYELVIARSATDEHQRLPLTITDA